MDIGQKLGRYCAEVAGRMENGRGALVRAVKMGPKWVQNGSKSSPRAVKMSERDP